MEDGLGREVLYISSRYHIKIKSNHRRRWRRGAGENKNHLSTDMMEK
jgi:hypothetical protein